MPLALFVWIRLQQALADAGLGGVLQSEEIPLDEHAVGRVTSEPVWAKISSPHNHASAMVGLLKMAINKSQQMPLVKQIKYYFSAVYSWFCHV